MGQTRQTKNGFTSKTTFIRVKIATHKRMKDHCAKHGLNMAAFADTAIRRALGFDGNGGNGAVRSLKAVNGKGARNGATSPRDAIAKAQEVLAPCGIELVLNGAPEGEEGRIKIGSIMLEKPIANSDAAIDVLPLQLVA